MGSKKPDIAAVLRVDSHQLSRPEWETLESCPDHDVGEATGLGEPGVLLDVSVQVAVRTVLDLLQLVLAHLR